MIIRLLIYLFVIVAPAVMAMRFTYRRFVAPRIEERRRRLLGAINAQRVCPVCTNVVEVDDETAIFFKSWFHGHCYRNLIT